jgi:hypothetical protein
MTRASRFCEGHLCSGVHSPRLAVAIACVAVRGFSRLSDIIRKVTIGLSMPMVLAVTTGLRVPSLRWHLRLGAVEHAGVPVDSAGAPTCGFGG